MRQHLQRFGPALLVISGCVLWGAALAANSVSHVAPRSAATAQKKSALRPEIPAIPAAALTPLTPAKVDRQAAYSPTGEKACLDCHDSAPSTLIHSTPHWVKADGRTPLSQHECESCHGASPEHIADPQKHDVAIVFSGKDASPLAERSSGRSAPNAPPVTTARMRSDGCRTSLM